MKYIYLFFITFLNLVQLNGQSKTIKINGTINGLGNAKVYFGNKGSYTLPGQYYPYMDSTIAKSNKFSIEIPLTECKDISIELGGDKSYLSFLGIPGAEYNINGDVDKLYSSIIEGNAEYNDYLKLVEVLEKVKPRTSVDSSIIKEIENYIAKYKSSTSALHALSIINRMYPYNTIIKLMNKLDQSVRQTEYYKVSLNGINPDPFSNWNKKIPIDTFYTLDNSLFDWNSLTKKYTVISFWASYCGPCIAEIPELNQLIKKYDINFVSISLDNDKPYWQKTIKRTGYPGLHINDFKSFHGALLNYFKIKTIPKLYLLDKKLQPIETDGTIEGLLKVLSSINIDK